MGKSRDRGWRDQRGAMGRVEVGRTGGTGGTGSLGGDFRLSREWRLRVVGEASCSLGCNG